MNRLALALKDCDSLVRCIKGDRIHDIACFTKVARTAEDNVRPNTRMLLHAPCEARIEHAIFNFVIHDDKQVPIAVCPCFASRAASE